jgi:hypothetical protein
VRIIQLVVSFGAVAISFGQQPANVEPPAASPPALEVKREPAASGQGVRQILQQYDFGAQLRALQEGETLALPSDVNPGVAAQSKAASGQNVDSAGVPKDYRPRVDVPLNATAMEAVRVSEKLRGETNPPAAGSDGRVLVAVPQQAGRLRGDQRFPVLGVSRSPPLEDSGLLLERGVRVSAVPRISHKRRNCSFNRDVVRLFRRHLRRWGGWRILGGSAYNACLLQSSASPRAASKSRAFSGGRNFAVDSCTREPLRVPRIRIGHFAPLPAQLRWSHSSRVQGGLWRRWTFNIWMLFLHPFYLGWHDLARLQVPNRCNLLILKWWRRGELNPRPKKPEMKSLRA